MVDNAAADSKEVASEVAVADSVAVATVSYTVILSLILGFD